MMDEIKWPCELPSAAKLALLGSHQEILLERNASISLGSPRHKGLFYVVHGTVMVGLDDKGPFGFLKTGDWFGGSLFLEIDKSPYDIVGLESSELYIFPFDRMQIAARAMPDIYKLLYVATAVRAHDSMEMIRMVSAMRLEHKVAYLLTKCFEGCDLNGEASALPDISQTLLAKIVGISRPKFNRALHMLQEEGVIAIDGRRIRLLRPAALEAKLAAMES